MGKPPWREHWSVGRTGPTPTRDVPTRPDLNPAVRLLVADLRAPGPRPLLRLAARVATTRALRHGQRDGPLAAVAVGHPDLERPGLHGGEGLEVGLADLVTDRRLTDLHPRRVGAAAPVVPRSEHPEREVAQ